MKVKIFFGKDYLKHVNNFLEKIPKYQITSNFNFKIIHKYLFLTSFSYDIFTVPDNIKVIIAQKDCPKIVLPGATYVLCQEKKTTLYNWNNYLSIDQYCI